MIVCVCCWHAEGQAEKRPVLNLTDEETKPAVSVFGIFKQVPTQQSPASLVSIVHNNPRTVSSPHLDLGDGSFRVLRFHRHHRHLPSRHG